MRVALCTPLPPQPHPSALMAGLLFAELATHHQLTVIADPATALPAELASRVERIGPDQFEPRAFDAALYVIGNDVTSFALAHGLAIRHPGIVLLEEPALGELYARLAKSSSSSLVRDEIGSGPGDARRARGLAGPLGARHLLETSPLVLVHASAVAEELAAGHPGAPVATLPQVAQVDHRAPGARRGVVFGHLGGLARHTRPMTVLRAFAQSGAARRGARLMVAGPLREAEEAARVYDAITRDGLGAGVEFHPELDAYASTELLEHLDVAIAIGRPRYGETSPLLTSALGMGCLVLASDVAPLNELAGPGWWPVSASAAREQDELAAAMATVLADRARLEAERRAGRARAASHHAPGVVAAQLGAHLAQVASRPAAAHAPTVTTGPVTGPSVNAIGTFAVATGVSEAARRLVAALLGAKVHVALEEVDLGLSSRRARLPTSLAALPRGRPHRVELSFVNVNELHVVPDAYLRRRGGTNYLIGVWHFELPFPSEDLVDQIERVDEIWVASHFVAEAFAPYTNKPILVVPCVAEPRLDPRLGRSDFGLPEDEVLFLCSFDAVSTLARKNPLGTIEAFARAFGRRRTGRARLVLKSLNLDDFAEAKRLLGDALGRIGGILIDEDLPEETLNALVKACDVYVSLHRAEGFGLGLAEAMALGKPVIATAYSGNLEFMSASDSLLVGYRMTEVDHGDLRFNPSAENVYRPGSPWAQPDVDQAARHMRYLCDHPSARARLGARARARVGAELSSRRVGALARDRLVTIEAQLETDGS